MPNHVHMILHISAKTPGDGPMWSSAPTDVNISTVMRTWKTLITKELGQSIFQRSYYDHVIRDEQSYVEIAEYIMGNPGKWAEDKYFFASKG
jgi:REP element-mobilizing transposase RayT